MARKRHTLPFCNLCGNQCSTQPLSHIEPKSFLKGIPEKGLMTLTTNNQSTTVRAKSVMAEKLFCNTCEKGFQVFENSFCNMFGNVGQHIKQSTTNEHNTLINNTASLLSRSSPHHTQQYMNGIPYRLHIMPGNYSTIMRMGMLNVFRAAVSSLSFYSDVELSRIKLDKLKQYIRNGMPGDGLNHYQVTLYHMNTLAPLLAYKPPIRRRYLTDKRLTFLFFTIHHVWVVQFGKASDGFIERVSLGAEDDAVSFYSYDMGDVANYTQILNNITRD